MQATKSCCGVCSLIFMFQKGNTISKQKYMTCPCATKEKQITNQLLKRIIVKGHTCWSLHTFSVLILHDWHQDSLAVSNTDQILLSKGAKQHHASHVPTGKSGGAVWHCWWYLSISIILWSVSHAPTSDFQVAISVLCCIPNPSKDYISFFSHSQTSSTTGKYSILVSSIICSSPLLEL